MGDLSFPQILLLGAVAGGTIFLGLPVGRLRGPRLGLRAILNAASAGILLFLLFEILSHSFEPLEGVVLNATNGAGSWSAVAGMAAVFVGGLAFGLLSLLYLIKWQRGRGARQSIGPGAMAVAEATSPMARHALQLGTSIAAGIGLHNFSEGLAIGQAAHGGQVQFAVLLVVGFALHNATEGFGIVGPLAASGVRASWAYLLMVGLIGGAPTFVGTLVGTAFTSQYVSVLFLSLAAGAIIFVIAEILNVGRRLGSWDLSVWGLLLGFVVGMGTELVIAAAGI